MDRDAELERFANACGFYTLTDPSPEGCVEQDDVYRRIQNVRRKLFEIYNYRICRQWHSNLFACPPHPVESEDRIFEIVVVDVLDLLAKPDRLLGRPCRVRIEPKRIPAPRIGAELGGDRAIAFELIDRIENSALEFVQREPVLRLQILRVRY